MPPNCNIKCKSSCPQKSIIINYLQLNIWGFLNEICSRTVVFGKGRSPAVTSESVHWRVAEEVHAHKSTHAPHIHTHTHTHTRMCAHTHAHIHSCTRTYTHAPTHKCMCAHTQTGRHAHTDRQTRTHRQADTHTDRQTHTQTGRHTHTDRQTRTHRQADTHTISNNKRRKIIKLTSGITLSLFKSYPFPRKFPNSSPSPGPGLSCNHFLGSNQNPSYCLDSLLCTNHGHRFHQTRLLANG